MSRRSVAVAALLVMTAIAGCLVSKTGAEKPVDGGTLRIAMFSAPSGIFNPLLYEEQHDLDVIQQVFSGLLRNDESLRWVCDLCESYEISPDNTRITFWLKQHVTWHDGAPFTAEDVAFTFRTVLHPDYTGVWSSDFASLAGAQKMLNDRSALMNMIVAGKITHAEAAAQWMADWQAWLNGDGQRAIHIEDAYTISFSTDAPYAPLISSLALPIAPAHIFAHTDIATMRQHPATRQPIGTGPYQFVEYKEGQYVTLRRYERYHMGRPHIAEILYTIMPQDEAIEQLRSGALDYTHLLPAETEMIQGDPNIAILERPSFGYQYIGLNHNRPLFRDVRVRQALMYGINRQAIVDILLNGRGVVMNSHIPPVSWAYEASVLNPYAYDPVRAAELLAQAGWRVKNSEGYLTKEGQVFAFTLAFPIGNKAREEAAPMIQANLQALGIKVDLQVMPFSDLIAAVFDRRSVDAWFMGWSLGIDPDPGVAFLPDNKWGRATGWVSAQSIALIQRGRLRLKPAERKSLYAEWTGLLNRELPYLFLYSPNDLVAIRSGRIKGLRPDARGALWNIWELWIPKRLQRPTS